jgi:aldehyde:ferredoxin oxidoreductase
MKQKMTSFGYMGKILHVDLSENSITSEQVEEETLRKFIGGTGLAVKILYDLSPPGYDAFDPDTPLIFMTGPFTGTAVPGSALYNVVSKSPLTGFTVARARSNGFFAPELKFAGFDGVIILGKAESPVYLWIHDGDAEIREAKDLWGEDTTETPTFVQRELGDPQIKVACIGPAGETVSRMACIVNDKYHVAARGGVGAVMGSKKLKAIAVRGKRQVPVFDRKNLSIIRAEWQKIISERKSTFLKHLSEYGTSGSMEYSEMRHSIGDLPTKNLTTGVFPQWVKLSGEYIVKNFPTKKQPAQCFGCSILHDQIVEIPKGPYSGTYAFPEYEDLAAWGSNLGIDDTEAVIKITDLANRYGIDSVEGGFTVSLAMECYEKKLISKNDTDGLELQWGNAEAVIQLLGKIKRREGIGNILAEGTKRAADHIGKGAQEFAVLIKNMAPMQHDIRSDWGKLLVYTIAGSGPCHEDGIYNLPDSEIGFPTYLPPFTTHRKAEAVRKTQFKRMSSDNLGICDFNKRSVPARLVEKAMKTVTGWDMSIEEAYEASERTINLIRVFNIRNGLVPSDDWPSPRLLEPPPDGGAQGVTAKTHLRGMIDDYYEVMGWDKKTGKPLVNTLRRLGLEYTIKDLWR